jgi:hypothetical protein
MLIMVIVESMVVILDIMVIKFIVVIVVIIVTVFIVVIMVIKSCSRVLNIPTIVHSVYCRAGNITYFTRV